MEVARLVRGYCGAQDQEMVAHLAARCREEKNGDLFGGWAVRKSQDLSWFRSPSCLGDHCKTS